MRIDPGANIEAFTKLADKSGKVQMQVGIGVMKQAMEHRRIGDAPTAPEHAAAPRQERRRPALASAAATVASPSHARLSPFHTDTACLRRTMSP